MKTQSKTHTTVVVLLSLVLAMLGLSYASVPLYRLFCQKTGYGGTPRIASLTQEKRGKTPLTVRFNADVDPNLPWTFEPIQSQITLYPGEEKIAYYKVKNISNHELIGMATYNVTPEKGAIYFNKVKCFCFEEQRLGPYEEVEMPVLFFVDPEIENDPRTKELKTLTLSYTFFVVKKHQSPLPKKEG